MRSSRASRPVAAFAALFAIWLHALLPPGFMPGVDTAGHATLELCDGGLIAAGRDFGPPAAPAGAPDDHPDQACAFAVAAAVLAPGDAPSVDTPVRLPFVGAATPDAPFREVRRGPVGARGPPAFAA